MQYVNSYLMIFADEIEKIVELFSLNRNNLLIESFSPGDSAIVVEKQGQKKFRLHIDLGEKRIIAAKQLGVTKSETHDFEKYTVYMK